MLISLLKSLRFSGQKFRPDRAPVGTLLDQGGTHKVERDIPDYAARLYIDLLRMCVSNSIYDNDLDIMTGQFEIDPQTSKYISTQPGLPIAGKKYFGGIWPTHAHTMIGIPRLENLQWCVERVLGDRIPGDFIETGVWRGGACIFMRGILKAYAVTDRRVWVADSFEGLPKSDMLLNAIDGNQDFHLMKDLAVSLEVVKSNFQRYGLLDEQVQFLKGWFCDTLPFAPIETLAIMRLDGDLYESTMDALENLYDKLAPGGFVIIDDYNTLKACNGAVEDFRKKHAITSEMGLIEGAGAFWRK